MNLFAQATRKLKTIYGFMFLLSIAASVVTVILILAHYDTGGISGSCNINDYLSCDKVNGSPWAVFYGIPVAILGLVYYLLLSAFALGLFMGFDFGNKLKPLTPRIMLHIGVIGAIVTTIIVAAIEYPVMGQAAVVSIVKAVLLIAAYTIIYKWSLKFPKTNTEFLGVMTLFSLYGVGFSLYLTAIEVFVLEAICIYCFAQQILIIIITGLSLFALKQSKHDQSK